MNKNEKEYRTSDGFIKISARASQVAEWYVLKNDEIGTDCDHRFKERLEICDGGADMTSFSLRDLNDREINIYVPYDPLEGVLHGSEMELSNCPSFEVDGEGNMIIAFGKRSKQPKRKDNNYAELIKGWKDAFGNFQPNVLKVKVNSLKTFGVEEGFIALTFTIKEKFCKKKFAELVFTGCKDISMEMFFPGKGDCEIFTSKMADGRIYVGLDGLGIDFICDSVLEYKYYCNRDEETE